MSLVDIHAQLDSHDEVLEKEAAVELEKLAEEDAAGRIMARGFMDELHKIAQEPVVKTPLPKPPAMPGGTTKTRKGFDLGKMKTGPSMMPGRRAPFAPKAEKARPRTAPFRRGAGITVGGNVMPKPKAPPVK